MKDATNPAAPQLTGGETPNIPKGTQKAFWCRVLNTGASRPCNRLLVYCNGYQMPLSDHCYDAPENAVPVGDDGDYLWTGWVEEACEQCETYWTYSGKVLAWMELPDTEESFAQLFALRSSHDKLTQQNEKMRGALSIISPDRIELIATHFDMEDLKAGRKGQTEVQDSLRALARAIRSALT